MTPKSQKKRKQNHQRVHVEDLVESLNTDTKALRKHHAVLACCKCHTIVGDTTSITAVYQLSGLGGHIALGSVTNCVVNVDDFGGTEYARVLGMDSGSALVCCTSDSCGQCLGIILAGIGESVLTSSFSLGLDHVDRYYLGSADMTLGGGDTDVVYGEEEEEREEEGVNEQVQDGRMGAVESEIETLRNHIETIQRVLESHDEELVLQNTRLREHGDLLKQLL